MPANKLEKAQLIEMAPDLQKEAPGGQLVNVQFNPETLKVSYSNQVVPPKDQGGQLGTVALQQVGKGSTKLAVQLWFDVNHPIVGAAPEDVREMTGQVTFFITPRGDKKNPETFLIPAVKFHWGRFSFVGVMDALEETIELFSSDGRPARASVTFSLTQQEILSFKGGKGPRLPASASAAGSEPVGTAPLTPASAGDTLQGLAERAGRGVDWQGIAAANGIENPRLLAPGQLVNVNASVSIGF
jgi:hypothetical protein